MDGTHAKLAAAAWDTLLAAPAVARLQAELPRYLAGCRWFGGKARRVVRVDILDAVPLERSRLLLLRVSYSEGDDELYALPVELVPAADADRARSQRADAEIAAVDLGGSQGGVVLFAADRDVAFSRAVVDAIVHERRFQGRAGAIVASRMYALDDRVAALAAAQPQALSAEQSNTSTRLGEVAVLKLLRRADRGMNCELEMGAYLTETARFRHVPPLLGAVEYHAAGGERHALALLHGFVRNHGDAWTLMLRSIGEFLHAVPHGAPPPLPGGPLLELADAAPPEPVLTAAAASLHAGELLGRRTAEMHVALADHPEVAAFRPEPFAAEHRRALHDEARAVVRAGLELLRDRRDTLEPGARERADRIVAGASALERRLDRILDRPLGAIRIRTHGDYHLGQVLWTGDDFVIIDFEGEPARSLAARRVKASPIRDVAGMIRSFHYAAYHGLARTAADDGARPMAEPWARAWYRWICAAFLRGYLETGRRGGIVPVDPTDVRDLLDVHLVEKAFYEVAYELNNRPRWVELPLEGVAELMASGAEGTEAAAADAAPPRGSRQAPRAAAREVRATPDRRDAVLPRGGPGSYDQHLWNEGTQYRAYRTLGAHRCVVEGVEGTSFAVWAPNAGRVGVIGDFNGWDKERHPLRALGSSGIWQGFLPGVKPGAVYKYHLRSRHRGYAVDKADPFGFLHEAAPATHSIVWDLSYEWGDGDWMRTRRERNALRSPMSIYEVHLGSWRRVPEEDDRPLTYREAAPLLADYAASMGFTHVELLPITEHPFYGSWGYQTTGYFAPTSRYGSPQDLMFLVDTLHQRGIGVILDWVPSHFPGDEHGLAYFDGTHLFEHADRRQGHHPDWDSFTFNYGRNEVRSFLISSALFWLDAYHVDGLRVDAVASMLYLDYSRKPGEWIPNQHGGRENLDAIAFLRRLNEVVYAEYPDVQTFAEESTAWPMVSRPLYVGGLGFGMKWDMGWMHDTLAYLRQDPVFRKFHHDAVTFRMMYAFSENFVLALSHDEVVHGKGSLLERMPGADRDKFANLRLLLGYMWAQPGKKLLFMGGEFGQGREWSHERSLDWHLLGIEQHKGVQTWVEDLNRLMRGEPALYERDFDRGGFEWIDCSDAESSVVSFLRTAGGGAPEILVVLNFTPVARQSYRIGVPRGGFWREILNGDAPRYGGAGWGNFGGQEAAPVGAHGRLHSLSLTLPPLSALFFRREG